MNQFILRLRSGILVTLLHLIGFVSSGQSIEKNYCKSYIELIESKDSLIINCSVHRERIENSEKIVAFEYTVRSQDIKGNEIRLSGYSSEYKLIFRKGQISYFTKNSYYSLLNERLKYITIAS